MPIQTNDFAATEELKRLSQFDTEPLIDEADLETILNASQICSVWAVATAYGYGDVVVPTTANQNGHRYRCVRAGTSLSTEPAWSEFQEARVSDGPTLIWEECGVQPKSLWDMRRAAHSAWVQKASKAAPDFDFSGAGESYKRSQVVEHCLEMASRYAPAKIA